MNKYEVLYILDKDLSAEAIDAQVEKLNAVITNGKGEVTATDKWGAKRLAYPINKKTEGFYVLTTFDAPPQVPLELERVMKISDEVMRYIVVAKD